MKSRSSSLMLPTRAPRKDFADTHNIFATLPTRDPQCGFPHFESWALGCEAAHSTFPGTKSAASHFAIGAVLAFVLEALLAQVDSELMVSCNVKKEEEGKSPEGRTNTVVVRIRGQLTSFLEDAPELGVLLLDFSLPTRGVDLVVHDERHSIERRERPGKIRVEIDPRPGEVVVSGHKGFTRDYRPAKGKAHRSSFKRDKTRSFIARAMNVVHDGHWGPYH
ncbi:hypothetical protein V6N13_023072 [Hibiscus sabdariffa]|uniref:Uncharacterized protein n=1 Tax=Hibiscus sabdariffa TaxID=183260 RepID=A0ABR2N691_9ROSI